MKSNFIKCGLIGWTAELLFTSFHALQQKADRRLIGQTSLLMFPIYGMAAAMKPLIRRLSPHNILVRGSIYTGLIYTGEYLSGKFLKRRGMCPWDYSEAKYNVDGIIRLDYAPAWFALGLVYERLLCPKQKTTQKSGS